MRKDILKDQASVNEEHQRNVAVRELLAGARARRGWKASGRRVLVTQSQEYDVIVR